MSLASRVSSRALWPALVITAGWLCAACLSNADGPVEPEASAACARVDDACQGAAGQSQDAGARGTHAAQPELDAGAPAHKSMKDAGADGSRTSWHDGGLPVVPLPCEIAAVLAPCTECHAQRPLFGAPMALSSWDDLHAPSSTEPREPVYRRVLERVSDDAMPMPPAPRERLKSAQLALLERWVAAGAPGATSATGCDPQLAAPMVTVATTPEVARPPVYVPRPVDCESTYELKAHGGTGDDDRSEFTVSGAPALQNNQYQCFYFSPSFDSDQSVLWYEPILDNVAYLHHWVLYATEHATHASGTSGPCNITQPGASFVALWAPGANNTSIPADVGLQLPTGPKAGLILELHYYNASGLPLRDASGIRFCTGAASKRPHTAATHQTGTEGICLPPGDSSVTGRCVPRTDLGASHIRGIWPHMHKLGRRMVVTVQRTGGTREVIHDQVFDFNSQVFYPKDVVINVGDTVDTTCYYSNDTNGQVHVGERTQDEMCYGFIMAWPPDSLASAPAPWSSWLGATGPAHRCVDNTSIARSCDGLADLPKSFSSN
ncbi:MAG: hypothetical protein JWN04_5336 [Myxococcaceae bacterium]|nr:hypothetical protein [Myxococcaceae bacterium]